MANQKSAAVSFDEMIQADRARKKNEQLAANIFGRNRPKKNEGTSINRSASNSPSLASRIGVTKRTSSTASNSSSKNPFRPSNSRQNSSQAQRDRANRASQALESSTPTTRQPPSRSGGLSIKGKAGPWTVLASNFAPGTTAADIQATFSRDAIDDDGQNGLISCHLTATSPSVTAELIFTERTIADRIISQYHNLFADGRYLKLSYQKQQQPPPQQPQPQQPQQKPPPTKPASLPREDPEHFQDDTDMMAVEDVASTQATAGGATETSRYDSDREAAAASRDRRERESRRGDDPRVVDDPRSHDGGVRREDDRGVERPHRDQDRDRDRDRDREPRYDDRVSYDRRYDDRPRYQVRGPSYRGGPGGGGAGGRGYGGGVRGSYARAAGMNGSGGRGGGYQNYR